jgi:hypothetical protein
VVSRLQSTKDPAVGEGPEAKQPRDDDQGAPIVCLLPGRAPPLSEASCDAANRRCPPGVTAAGLTVPS